MLNYLNLIFTKCQMFNYKKPLANSSVLFISSTQVPRNRGVSELPVGLL